MSKRNQVIVNRLVLKANKSLCTFKVSAIGFSKKGNLLGISFNTFRFSGKGGGAHAEAKLIRKFSGALGKIIIARVGRSGDLLPIHPCENCQKLARKYEIKIETICETYQGEL
jgi:hypothetical protein